VTTAPAPTTVSSPMLTPGQTMTPPPSHTLSAMVIGAPYSQPSRRGIGSMGWVAASSWTCVASQHVEPSAIGAMSSMTQSKLTKVPSPIVMFVP
jgi:hypothetical protein